MRANMMSGNARDDEGNKRDQNPLQHAREDLYAAQRGLVDSAGEARRSDEALAELLDVVQKINAELDVERVLGVAARQIIDIFEAERVFIADVSSEGRIGFRLAVTFRGRTVPDPENEVSQAVIHDVARSREPVLVADATTDPRFAQVSSVLHLQLHSVMAAPLMAQGELLGVVYADNRLVSGAFDQRALNLLGLFANHVGIALRNAQLFRELNAARAELALSERLRTIGEVATFVAHEVKNPLGSIQILLGALQERWDEPELRATVFEVVPREVERLNRAVSQILDYARPTPLIKVPVELAALVRSSLKALEPQIGQAGVTISTDFERDIPAILADGERLREVFLNLTKNSLEAMADAPRKELRVSVRRQGVAREEVTFEDTGSGIPEDEIDSIFEAFRTHKKAGTGVGLALCQKVVREHGGHIAVENTRAGGARFRLSFPISGA